MIQDWYDVQGYLIMNEAPRIIARKYLLFTDFTKPTRSIAKLLGYHYDGQDDSFANSITKEKEILNLTKIPIYCPSSDNIYSLGMNSSFDNPARANACSEIRNQSLPRYIQSTPYWH